MMQRSPVTRTPVSIPAGEIEMGADLTVPQNAFGLVLFVHGSGSSRFSSRNRYVGERLNERGCATLLADLLTQDEARKDARTAEFRFDIDLLVKRTVAMVEWTLREPSLAGLSIGLFGASTGGAAAVIAADRCGSSPECERAVRAVVSRGGRIDLAGASLERLKVPLLMLVGELDEQVLELHEDAVRHLNVEHRLEVLPGASHLFEEPGALERVAELAAQWFERYLAGGRG